MLPLEPWELPRSCLHKPPIGWIALGALFRAVITLGAHLTPIHQEARQPPFRFGFHSEPLVSARSRRQIKSSGKRLPPVFGMAPPA